MRELARRLGVTPAAITQMESSDARGVIQVATLERALRAMGAELVAYAKDTQPPAPAQPPALAPAQSPAESQPFARAPFMRREDRVAFELHRAVAHKLLDNPTVVRSTMAKNIADMRGHVRGRLPNVWLDRWLALSTAPLGELFDAMLATDERGIDMRQNGPFLGVLTQSERLQAIARAGHQ